MTTTVGQVLDDGHIELPELPAETNEDFEEVNKGTVVVSSK